MDEIAQNILLRRAVFKRLKDVEVLIAKGKGTLHKKGYVRDSTWYTWNGMSSVLRALLHDAKIDAPEFAGDANDSSG